MPAHPYAYLTGSLLWLAVWAALFAALKPHRRAMIWTSLCLAPTAPLSEIGCLRDYWHPPFILELRWGGWHFGGVEDYILGFALSGICAGVFEGWVVRRGAARLPPVRWRSIGRLAVWPGLGLLGFMGGLALGLRSIDSLLGAILLASGAMLARRRAPWAPALGLSVLFALAYQLFYVGVFLPWFPGSIEAFWNLENTWGIQWGGVPLEETIWAGLTMLFAGPYFRAALAPWGGGEGIGH